MLVLFEDDFCVIANKPNNVLVHHAHHSRNKIDEDSLLQLLENQLSLKLYPVHRLDRKTSGILLLAKKTAYVSEFQNLFTKNEIEKTYYAIVRGFSPSELVINSPVKGRDADVYKDAETHLTTLQTIELNIPVKPYDKSRYSLVKLLPKTGRMHQLRIHLTKISHPIIGDPKYGDKNHNIMYENQWNATHLFLHAASLEFVHPFTSQKLLINAPFPENWISIFNHFDWNNPIVQ